MSKRRSGLHNQRKAYAYYRPREITTISYEPGLNYDWYIGTNNLQTGYVYDTEGGNLGNLDFFNQTAPTYSGTGIQELAISSSRTDLDYSAVRYSGYFLANITGTWAFTLTGADDLASIWIGAASTSAPTTENSVVAYNYTGNTNQQGYYEMEAGMYYPILIYWGQSYGGLELTLIIYDPNENGYTDGTGYFFHQVATRSIAF